jgi:hypothetical protein
MSLPRLLLLSTLALAPACGPRGPDAEPEVDRNPAMEVFDEDLRRAPLVQLEAAIAALEARDDLRAIEQMERLKKEIEALEPSVLEDHPEGLPGEGMSEAEADLERRLAERLLAGGTVLEDPQ